MPRQYHIADVLSITTGKLLSPRLMEGVYDILDYMTGDNIYTHQLPRAGRECAPWLLKRHPFLAEIKVDHIDQDNWEIEIEKIIQRYGRTIEIEPIPKDEHDHIDPITEVEKLMGKDKIIIIER
ncbi:MAG: hypothetical protein PHG61_09840 [Candidatus Marinimicrobia bacterium]|nr:hypothetical protein [Candidatus Neomarinimicrobiota bacterium]